MATPKLWAGLVVLALAAGTAQAQDGNKKKGKRGPFGAPASAELKEKLGLSDEQVEKIDACYKEAGEKDKELKAKIKDGGDKKAVGKEIGAARKDLLAKVRECLNEEQQKTFDETYAKRKKKTQKTDQP